MSAVVGVHGIFQYKFHADPGALAELWRDALGMAGPSAGEFELAYYAPLLHTATPMGDSALDDLSAAERILLTEWLGHLEVPEAVAQGGATAWLRDGLDWLIRTGRAAGVTRTMVRSVLAEVAAYASTTSPDARLRVQGLVVDVIHEHQPRVLIAHSLGSVVAYETLWAHPDLQVPLLVTLGSPLAIKDAFYDSFVPEAARAHAKPPGVERWINFADVGDLVAVPKGLSGYFAGIDSDETVTIDTFECHRIVQYLSNPRVAAAIRNGAAR